MLTLQLKSGEYLTIGKDIAIRVVEQPGSSFLVSVKAPREVPILRGEVLERTEKRPEGLSKHAPKSASRQAHNAKQLQKLAEKRERAESARKQKAEEQAAVARELREILRRMNGMTGSQELRGELEVLQSRLDGLAE